MIDEKRPIFALSTPKARGAIGVFRISGKNCHNIIKKISSKKRWKKNTTSINYLLDEEKRKIDKTITVFFNSPNTYTGENMVEISCHGGLAIINKISQTLINSGLRPANPGEFTKRSLLNDKLDLTQVEGVSDLVNAETEQQRIVAFRNLEGHTSSAIKKLNLKITKMLADTEALIDFSDEDLPKNTLKNLKEQNKNIIKLIKRDIKRSALSKTIRDGFLIGILGKPNTGKSSFLNYISGREVAIVTNIPGTTTDSLEVPIDIDGFKFRFIDTAGIRKHKNAIEKIGVERAKKISLYSNLNVVFLDRFEKEKYKDIPNKIFVRSKQDIRKKSFSKKGILNISSKTGFGVSGLIKKIKKNLIKSDLEKNPVFSRERHIMKIKNCLKSLESINFDKNIDIASEEIRNALKETQEIYQKFDIEKILDIIFTDFCIGK